MMQPLSLQPRFLAGSMPLMASSVPAARLLPQMDASPAANRPAGTGQLDMMSLMVPLLQLFMQVFQMLVSGQGLSPAGQSADSTGGGSYGSSQAGSTGTYGGAATGENSAPSGDTSVAGSAESMTIEQRRNLNYSDLKADPNGGNSYDNVRGGKESFNGVSGQDAAIMHLAGRGHISAGTTENGVSGSARIYNNVLNNPENFTPDEVSIIKKYAAAEKAKYGYFTGEGLDHDFAEQMAARGDISPDKLQAYHQSIDARVAKMVNNPDQAAIAKAASQEVNITSDIGTLEKQSGLSRYEQAVYRLSGHSTLFSGDGSINGDILAITLGNENSLDGRSFGDQDTNIDPETLSLLQDDLAIDGKLNGDSLRAANEKVLDKIFMGGPDVTAKQIRAESVQQAQQNGRTSADIQQSLQLSANKAIKDFGGFVKDHPVMTAVGAGAMAGAAAVCPFLAGTMAVGAGIAAGSRMMSREAKPAA